MPRILGFSQAALIVADADEFLHETLPKEARSIHALVDEQASLKIPLTVLVMGLAGHCCWEKINNVRSFFFSKKEK